MKINNKGLSLIEIIVSIALIATVTLFMYRLLADVTFQKNNEYFASLNQETKVEILQYIKEHYDYNVIDTINCNANNTSCTLEYSNDVKEYPLTLSLQESSGKWYLVFEEDNTVIKKWYLSQINGGKILYKNNENDSGMIHVNIELYTNNFDNNENNNNTLDDICFTINTIDYTGTKVDYNALKRAFVTVQCVQEGYNTRGWGYTTSLTNNPSGYDFASSKAYDCNFKGIYDSNSTGTKNVLRVTHHPVEIKVNENDKTIYVHFCRTGGHTFIFGQYSIYGEYSNDPSFNNPVNNEYFWFDYKQQGPLEDSCPLGHQPCRSRYSNITGRSHFKDYSIEFITHYYQYPDVNAADDDIKYNCMNFINNLEDDYPDDFLYVESMQYTYSSRDVLSSVKTLSTCKNADCLNSNGTMTLNFGQ